MNPVEAVGSGAATHERVDGILVLGAFGSGTDLVSELLDRLGLHHGAFDPSQSAQPGRRSDELCLLNEFLLEAVGGTSGTPPTVSPHLIAAELQDQTADAVDAFHRVFGVPAGFSSNGEPWVWADPRLSFLGPFWVRALAITSHRDTGPPPSWLDA